MFSPWARDFIRIASVGSAVKLVPGGDKLVNGVQCYELFGGIALKKSRLKKKKWLFEKHVIGQESQTTI